MIRRAMMTAAVTALLAGCGGAELAMGPLAPAPRPPSVCTRPFKDPLAPLPTVATSAERQYEQDLRTEADVHDVLQAYRACQRWMRRQVTAQAGGSA